MIEFLCLASIFAGCDAKYLSVARVLEHRETLNGQRVRVRGWAELPIDRTFQRCGEIPCCNIASAILILKAERTASLHWTQQPSLSVSQSKCSGNECSVACEPFDPTAAPAFELTGTLKINSTSAVWASLEDLDVSSSYQLNGGDNLDMMLPAPIVPGRFTLTLPRAAN